MVKNNLQIGIGQTVSIIDEYSYGWLLSVYWVQNSPDINMKLLFESKQGTTELEIKPRDDHAAFAAGTGMSSGIGFTLRKYDLINSIFSYTMRGNFPGAPWAGTLRVTATNEGIFDAMIVQLWVHRIVIEKALPRKVVAGAPQPSP